MKKNLSIIIVIALFCVFPVSVSAQPSVSADFSRELIPVEDVFALAQNDVLINNAFTTTTKFIEQINTEYYIETVKIKQIQSEVQTLNGTVENGKVSTFSTIYRGSASASRNGTDGSATVRTYITINYNEQSFETGVGTVITSTYASWQRLDSSFRVIQFYFNSQSNGAGYTSSGIRKVSIDEPDQLTVSNPAVNTNYYLYTYNSDYVVTGTQGVAVTTSFQRNTGGPINTFVLQLMTKGFEW